MPSACSPGPTPERLAIASGKTVLTRDRLAVTYQGASHDSFDDGSTDLRLQLMFQGVMEDGSPTPSALSWTPSAFAKPAWVHLAVNVCAQVVDGNEDRIVLELFRPPSAAK